MTLDMRGQCERCGVALPLSAEAYICSYERAFCAACAGLFWGGRPMWKAEFLRRPRRMEE